MSDVELVGTVFAGTGKEGDFLWMIERDEHRRALFIFNDNEESFRIYREAPHAPAGYLCGGGNAAIRPYRRPVPGRPPRAAGIPTGRGGRGYDALTDDARAVIDEAIALVGELLDTGEYDRVYYSSDGKGGLGTGIFSVADEVKTYIVERLRLTCSGSR